MKYKELQTEILKRAKNADACIDEYKKAYKAINRKQLLKVVKENISWCYNREVITIELLDVFGEKLCNEFGIFYKGEIKKITERKGLVFLGDFKCEMLDSSQVDKMWDSSQVGEMRGDSQVGEMFGNSQVGEMWDSSKVGKMWINSIARSYNGNRPKELGHRCCFVDLKNNQVFVGKDLKTESIK